MNIIAFIILFLIVSPLAGWMVFLDVVRIRKELAETRYFNVTADCNEYVRADIRMNWEE